MLTLVYCEYACVFRREVEFIDIKIIEHPYSRVYLVFIIIGVNINRKKM